MALYLIIGIIIGVFVGVLLMLWVHAQHQPPKPYVPTNRHGFIKQMLKIDTDTVNCEIEVEELTKLHSGKLRVKIVSLRIFNRKLMKQVDEIKAVLPTIYTEEEIDWVGDLSRKGIIDGILKDLE